MNKKRCPVDINGRKIEVGNKVKLLSLSGDWFEQLPDDERSDVESMIDEVLVVEEIDEYGYPWVTKKWMNSDGTECNSHCIALENHEMQLVE